MNIKNLYINQKCVSEQLDDQLIILNIETSQYHELNSMGMKLWEEVEQGGKTREQLIKKFNKGNNQIIKNDITKFLDSLIKRKLLIEK